MYKALRKQRAWWMQARQQEEEETAEVRWARALRLPRAGTAALPQAVGSATSYICSGRQNRPWGALCPRPAQGQLQSACKPPCRWVSTPRSSSLELGLTHSEHKLVKGSGEERRGWHQGWKGACTDQSSSSRTRWVGSGGTAPGSSEATQLVCSATE